MTFKYAATFAITGSHKLRRFQDWASQHLPELAYSLPMQTPVKAEAMTVRLRSLEDRALLMETIARHPLPDHEDA
jgi:hypothetical protein